MPWYTILALVLFLVLCVITSLLVLLTSNKSTSMGIFGSGSAQTPFGSRSTDVLTRITSIFVILFFLSALGVAILVSAPKTVTDEPVGSAPSTMQGVDTGTTEGATPANE